MVHKEGGGPASECKIDKNTIKHGRTVQLIGAAAPNVPNQAPMPQASKQLLKACAVPPMYIIIALLACCQSSILSSNEWHNDMNSAFIRTIMAPKFKIGGPKMGTLAT